jgi:hypothetical protein
MLQEILNHNSDLNQLKLDGYDIELSCGSGGYLLVHQIPYVTPAKQVDLGTLVCVLTYASPTKLSPPHDHTIYFCGETPCNADGVPLDSIINNSQRQQLTSEILVTHYFSSKPKYISNYPDYFEKIRVYAEILSIHAKAIDSAITTKPNKKK